MPAKRSGELFEIGPDGYGYLLDLTEPGRSYAFDASLLEERPPEHAVGLEGSRVSFVLVGGVPTQIKFLKRPLEKIAGANV